MKRILILTILLMSSLAWAGSTTVVVGQGGVAAAESGGSQTRYPTGNGSVSWTKGGSSAAATNWGGVDEETADDGVTYNYRAGSTGTDYFTFTAPSVPEGATNISVTVYVRQQRTAAGACYARSYLRVNSTNYNGTGHSDPGETWGTQSYAWTTNPNTTEAWTVDDVNGTGAAPLQNFGYSATGMAAGEQVNVTQCYMVVTWE